jgi:hypothetical protein
MSHDFGTPEDANETQTPEDGVLAPATPFAGGAAVEPGSDTAPAVSGSQAPDEDVIAPATPFAGGAAVEPIHET